MDILTHTLSGVAIGTVAASYINSKFKNKLKLILLSGLAGALPDIDALSLWSKFDATIGDFFNLSASGKSIYSAKYWYSHHAFFHSILAGLMITILLGLLSYSIDRKIMGLKNKNFMGYLINKRVLLLSFFLGYILHLIEDMPTPASTWGGINFFYPSKSYIGGTGEIWWWNNYDIFLIVVLVIIINLSLSLFHKFIRFDLRKLTIGVFILGFSLIFFQIKTRNYDFAYTGYTKNFQKFEAKSKEIQKEILGDRLYRIMENFDNKLKLNF